ncbi:MAG: peptidoglycan-binding protein [Acidobacteriota bacterium]|nr:peptidoglycan-binding protein [Acidobacteriota bacterium]
MTQPTANISSSVGVSGTNRPTDVAWIQAYLNMVPPSEGGPAPKLKQDGLFGPKTKKAIEDFQRRHFGRADGRVDPAKQTEQKLIALETSPSTRPAIHVEPARRQAQIWMDAGLTAVRRNIGTAGNVTLDPRADQRFVDLFELAFRLNLRESGLRAPSAKHLVFVRQKFERAVTLLRQPIRTLEIRFMAVEDGLRAPRLSRIPPLAIASNIILANYKFTDFDEVCGYGTGPFTRAAMLLQAAFIAADPPSTTVVASELFIVSGLAPPEVAIRDSGHFSFFCQGMDAGGVVPRPFHHAPEAVGGWNDRPGLL